MAGDGVQPEAGGAREAGRSPAVTCPLPNACHLPEDYQQLIEDIVRDGRLYASENHQEILKVSGLPPGIAALQ